MITLPWYSLFAAMLAGFAIGVAVGGSIYTRPLKPKFKQRDRDAYDYSRSHDQHKDN